MRIVSTGTAFPAHYFPQAAVVEALKEFWGQTPEQAAVLARLHSRTGVDGRHFCLPLEKYRELDTWGKRNDAWIHFAACLGQRAIQRALQQANISGERLGAIFFTSVTGIASPSIDALLINRMQLPINIRRVPIFGLGCVAGAAGIARAADYVRAYPDQVAILLAVELCSLTWQREDTSVANLISAGLFGDGAAAVVVAGSEAGLPGVEIVASESAFFPNTEEIMGWNISEMGFRIMLSPDVPRIVREHMGVAVDAFLARYGLNRHDIGTWIMHTGGPKVLEATAEVLDLPAEALEVSWNCLRRVGNLSSASVLVVLDEILAKGRPQPGTLSILAAMGPGFCAEMVLLRW